MNAETLTSIFETELLPLANRVWGQNEWHFLQDNAPAHRANHTKQWLIQHELSCFEFPPYSPDLNPIENLWAHLKRDVELDFPRDAAALTESIKKRWVELPNNYLALLAHSMGDRLKAVTVCRGFRTKY